MPVTGVRLIQAKQAPLLARPFYAHGDPGPIVAALAHVPELLEVTMPFLDAALGPSAVDARTKELVILRTSAVMGCRYCVQTHTVVARNTGLSVDEVAALRWVEVVAVGPGQVPDAARREASVHLSEAELVELTLLVGATLLLNRFCTALELPTSPKVLGRLAKEGWS
jgi:AhpD family alkylhydroperoxidase